MGINYSSYDIKQYCTTIFDSTTVNNVMKDVKNIMELDNSVVFRNYDQIDNVDINISSYVKNEMIADTLLETAEKNNVREKVLQDINLQFERSGQAQINTIVYNQLQQLKTVVDVNTVNNLIHNVRNSFKIRNSVIVERNSLVAVPSGYAYVKNFKVSIINEDYNFALSQAVSKIAKENGLEITPIQKGEINDKNTGILDSSSLMYIAIGAVAIAFIITRPRD